MPGIHVAGPELEVISESGLTLGYSAPTISPGGPLGMSSTLGPSLLMRNLSGSGLGRLNRVGSNPLSDMSRHSLPQVCSSSCLSAAVPLLALQSFQG